MNSVFRITLRGSISKSSGHPIVQNSLGCIVALRTEKHWIITTSSSTILTFPEPVFYPISPFLRANFAASYLRRFLTVSLRSFADVFPAFPTSSSNQLPLLNSPIGCIRKPESWHGKWLWKVHKFLLWLLFLCFFSFTLFFAHVNITEDGQWWQQSRE